MLAKVFLPPGLGAPWSVGRWAVRPLLETAPVSQFAARIRLDDRSLVDNADTDGEARGQRPVVAASGLSVPTIALLAVWGGGCLLFWAIIAARCTRLARVTRSAQAIDEGPVRVAFEQIAIELDLRRVPDLVTTGIVTSPFLFGVIRPRVVVPEETLGALGESELRAMLAHELVHFKRRDTWIGWLQVIAQSIFWFHPFLWWANRQLRHERKCACDEAVLRLEQTTPDRYCESLVHVLTAARGRSVVAGNLVGVFERGTKLQNRMEGIMNYVPSKRQSSWSSRFAIVAIAVVFLPLAPSAESGLAETPHASQAQTWIVKTVPAQGATDVDRAVDEISVTFDRDMGRGMSWTGGEEFLPPIDKSRKARWSDARTCVLPVKLPAGSYYRVGINSTSFQNFRSAQGEAAPHAAIYFATQGASAEIESRVRAPEIIAFEPKNGAQDVDAKTTALRVTFNMPMGDGMSWVGSGRPNYPPSPGGKQALWSADRLSCTLPVVLEAGRNYELELNDPYHINFQSQWGVPLAPVTYKIRTR